MKTLPPKSLLLGATIAVLFCVLAFFSFSHLTESPPISYDEGVNDQVSLNETLYGKQEIQIAPGTFVTTPDFVSTGYPVVIPVSWSLKYFGIGIEQVRLVMIVFIFAMAAIFLVLIAQMFGLPLACTSLALLVTFAPIYGDGKTLLGEVPGMFFLGGFLLSLVCLEKRNYKGIGLYCLAGIFAGLCLATKPIFLILGGAVLVGILFHRKSIVFRWKSIFISFLAFLIPVALWIIFEFGYATQTSTVLQVLHFYYNPTGAVNPSAQILPNILRFFHDTSCIYFMLVMIVWIIGYAVRVRTKAKIYTAETIALVFSLLVWVAFLRTQGYYRYFFEAEILALAFLPIALWSIIQQIRILDTKIKKYTVFGIIFVVVFILQLYPLLFTSWIAIHTGDSDPKMYPDYFSTLSATTTYFVYNEPQTILFLGSKNYYQYLPLTPQNKVGLNEIPVLAQGLPDMVIISPTDWQPIASTTLNNYEFFKALGGLDLLVRNPATKAPSSKY